jgi:hypothetical protein
MYSSGVQNFPDTFGFGTNKFHPPSVQGTMVIVKHTAVKLLQKSDAWVPTDTSESVIPLLAPCKHMPDSGTNVADMLAFSLIPKDSLPQKTPMLNSQLIYQETIMTVYQKIQYGRVRSNNRALVQLLTIPNVSLNNAMAAHNSAVYTTSVFTTDDHEIYHNAISLNEISILSLIFS